MTTTDQWAERRAWAGFWASLACRVVLGTLAVAILWSVGPLAFGWSSVVVASGSMEPRLHPGDVVVARPITAAQVRPGMPVLVENPARPGHLLLHRVVRKTADGSLITKGDANEAEDSTPVPPSAVRALPRLLVRWVGLPVHWYDDREYLRAALSVAGLAMLGWLASRSLET